MSRRKGYAVAVFLTIIMTFLGNVPANWAGNGGGGNTAPDYGDQVVLYRDTTGVPVLSDKICPEELGDECEATAAIGGLCRQPIASEVFAGCVYTDEEVSGEAPACLVPVDQTTCAPVPEYEYLQMEVDFGRINLVRSPEDVLAEQLQEALYNLTTAGCLSRDAAGRFVYSALLSDSEVASRTNSPLNYASRFVYNTLLSDGEVDSHTIDSPLQNLAIFWKIMKDGKLDENIDIGETAYDVALTAARGLGASSDKSGEITVDMFSYLSEMLGLSKEGGCALFEPICIKMREEVQGEMVLSDKCYLDLSGFSYSRGDNFNSLPSPAYIPADDPVDGFFEYLVLDADTATLEIVQGPILEAVPQLSAEQNLGLSGIKAFVQAADDTRATIEFMHTWEVPEEFKTPVNCEVATGEWFDVSISERSGLQVPVRMVVGADEREMIVTIQNAGPATANGTVYVNAVDMDETGKVYYSFSKEFTGLEAGFSASWVDIIPAVEEPCSLLWTAVVVTALPDGTDPDVNLENNDVSEITRVISSGGGH